MVQFCENKVIIVSIEVPTSYLGRKNEENGPILSKISENILVTLETTDRGTCLKVP